MVKIEEVVVGRCFRLLPHAEINCNLSQKRVFCPWDHKDFGKIWQLLGCILAITHLFGGKNLTVLGTQKESKDSILYNFRCPFREQMVINHPFGQKTLGSRHSDILVSVFLMILGWLAPASSASSYKEIQPYRAATSCLTSKIIMCKTTLLCIRHPFDK